MPNREARKSNPLKCMSLGAAGALTHWGGGRCQSMVSTLPGPRGLTLLWPEDSRTL